MNARRRIRHRGLSFLGLFGLLAAGFLFLRQSGYMSSPGLHTLMEALGTTLSLTAGVLALVRYYSKKNDTILLIATGFLGAFAFDAYHTIVTSSYFHAHFPSAPSALVPWSWTASRVFLSGMLLLSWVVWKRDRRQGQTTLIDEKYLFLWAGVFVLGFMAFFSTTALPPAHFPRFLFPRPEEFLSALLFLAALGGVLQKGYWKRDHFDYWLVLCLIASFTGQALFMASSGRLFDPMFDAAHLLKIASYLFVLTGLVINMHILFRRAEEASAALQRSAERLRSTNARIGALAHAAENISSTLELGQMTQEIYQESKALFGIHRFGIISYEPERKRWRWLASGALSGDFRTHWIRRWNHTGGAAAAWLQKPNFISDALADPRTAGIRGLIEREGFASLAVLPLTCGHEAPGVLVLCRNARKEFSEEECLLARAFSEHVSSALQNALAFRRSQHEAGRLQALMTLSHQVSQSLAVNEVLDTVTRSAVELLGGDTSRLYILGEGGESLRLASWSGIEEDETRGWVASPHMGLRGTILQTGEPLLVADMSRDGRTDRVFRDAKQVYSYIGVPFRVDGRVAGILNCMGKRPGQFGGEDIPLLQSLADMGAIGIQNAQLFESSENRGQRLATLAELNRSITENLDPAALLDSIARAVTELLHGDLTRIFLLDPETDQLKVQAWDGTLALPRDTGRVFDKGEGVIGRVLDTGEAVLHNNLQEESRWVHKEWARKHNLQSYVAQPLRESGKILGVISCVSRKRNFFSDEDLDLLGALASQAAVAIENAKLYQESGLRGRRLETLVEVTRRFTRGLDLSEILQTIVDAAAQVFQGDASFRLLRDEGLVLVNMTPGMAKLNLRKTLRPGESLSGQAVASGKPLVSRDISSDPRYLAHDSPDPAPGRTGAAMCVPMKSEGRILGVLLIRREPGHLFTEADVQLAVSLADQGAIAIQNGRLFERLRNHAHDLKVSEARFRSVIESAQDGVIAIDEKGTVTLFNKAAEEMFGYAADEIIGRNVNLLMPSPHREHHDEYLAAYLQTGVTKAIGIIRTLEGRRKSGETFSIDLSVGEVSVSGERFFTGIVRDITERHEVDRMKNEFISVVSHEIRTPLTSLRGSLGLLSAGLTGDLSEQTRELLRIATNNSDRLIRLINDILDLDKIESGKMELRISPGDAASLIARAAGEMEGLAAERGVALRLETPSCTVLADPDAFLQVVTNLLSNAIKFSEAGSEVTVGLRQGEGFAEIRVEDRGRGIPPESLDKIFGKFMQADSSDAREKGGTGLGLAICKAIVGQHGGEIWVESEVGEGSTFFFTLPCPEGEPAPPPAPAAPARPSVASVLICDDDVEFLRILQLSIEREGFPVVLATTGEEALGYLGKNPVSAVVLDIHLPGMSGLELLGELKKRPGTKNLPVIVVSGSPPPADMALPGPLVLDWLQKPIDEKSLLRALRHLADTRKTPEVLLVDDDEDLLRVNARLLRLLEVEVRTATSGRAAVERCREKLPDLLILDISMPGGDGFHVIDEIRGDLELTRIPLIVYSAREPTPEEKRRLSVETTVFLTKSKTPPEQFEKRVADLLNGLLQNRQPPA